MRKLFFILFLLFPQISQSQWEGILVESQQIYQFENFRYRVYASTKDPKYPYTYYRLWYSWDGGTSWGGGSQGIPDEYPTIIKCMCSNDSLIFASSYLNSLYYLKDPGENWINIPNKPNSIIDLDCKDTTVYAITNGGGVYFTNDLGKTWAKIKFGFTIMEVDWFEVDGSYQLARSKQGIFLSKDNGLNWSKLDIDAPNYNVTSFIVLDNVLIIGTASKGIYLSIDGGAKWEQVLLVYNGINSGNILLLKFHKIIFAGTSLGVFVSEDIGQSWVNINYNYDYMHWVTSIIVNSDNLLVGTLDMGAKKAKINDLLPLFVSHNDGNFSKSELIIFPNPVSESMKIKLSDKVSQYSSGMITITNNLGEEYANLQINDEFLNYGIDLDVSAFPSGIYYCYVKVGSYFETQPFIVIH